ncbi:MAG TPA: ribosomal protein S18-alanine N-acetyltransferase [Acidimicrobiales bacterium]|nr:ribosomal protein S18-alanine N-acetyltransferase [Acidimicrobiales bacterium]
MVMQERDQQRTASAPVRVGPMRRRHLRGVLRIEEQVNPRPWSLSLFMSELRYTESRAYLVARIGTEIVGYAGLMLVAGDGHVTNVGVDPDHRRQGIATRLMLELTRRALEEGAEALTLEVRMSNTGAQELYRRFGFVPAGVRKGYYSDANEDALIMWATDIDTPAYRARLHEIEQALPTPTIREAT